MRTLLLLLLVLVAGCRDTRSHGKTKLTVFAATSLVDAFVALEADFERRHPKVDVVLNFAGSQVLRQQIEQGAPADLFASANVLHMTQLTAKGLCETPATFARGRLVLLVPSTSPIQTFEQLTKATRVVLGTQASPVGQYAEAVLTNAGKTLGAPFEKQVRGQVVSREANARLVRTKVVLGEADAAFVYETDAKKHGVRVIAIPEAISPTVSYLAATVSDTPSANVFFAYLQSKDAQAILKRHGFRVP